MNDPDILSGSIAGLMASSMWAISSVLYSRVPASAQSIATFKNVVATILMGLVLFAMRLSRHEQVFQATQENWTYLGLSAIVGLAIGDIAFFRSLQLIGPRLGLTLTLLSPPLISLMGQVFLGESLPTQCWMAIAITLLGLGIVMRDRSENEDVQNPTVKNALFWGVALALFNVVCHSSGAIPVSYTHLTLPTKRIV